MLSELQGLGMLLPTCPPLFSLLDWHGPGGGWILKPSLLFKISGALPRFLWLLTIWQCHGPDLCCGQAACPGLPWPLDVQHRLLSAMERNY